MPKHTTAQREKIKSLTLELYLIRVRAPSDIQKVLTKELNVLVSERQIARYIQEVRGELRASAKFDRDEEIGKALARLEEVYRRALQKGRFTAALRAQRELNELMGLKLQPGEGDGRDLHTWMLQQAAERDERDAADKAESDKRIHTA